MSILLGNRPDNPTRGMRPPVPEAYDENRSRSTATEDVVLHSGAGKTPEEMKRWINAQIPYENLADSSGVAQRAVNYVTTHRKLFEEKTEEIRDKWRSLWALLRGFSLSRRYADSDIHVPELYKAMETIVPRIEEALLDYDPWFLVRGRDKMDRVIATKLQAFLEWQLREAKWPDIVQPAIRCMLVYGFVAIKVFYDVRTAYVVEKSTKTIGYKDGAPLYETVRKEVNKVLYAGPRLEIVDPLDWVCDTSKTETNPGLFEGDRFLRTYEELHAAQEMGMYKNVEQLKNKDPGHRNDWRTFDRQVRSIEFFEDQKQETYPDGTPPNFAVEEFWGLFDPYGRGQAREYRIVVAAEDVCLSVTENPNDDKHRPYAIARAQKEHFDFFNIAPLDHALRLNIELDDVENLGVRATELALSPHVWVKQGSDLPDNIFDIEPGTVFETAEPPTWYRTPQVVNDMLALKGDLRRDIEETIGSPRIYEGTAGGGTATEIERRIQEGNRRLRGTIRAFSRMTEGVLKRMHAINAQWIDKDVTFRVLGRRAKGLSAYEAVGPETFDHEIDFEFIGLAGLKSQGLRATQISTALNQIAPLIPLAEGRVNVPGMIVEYLKDLQLGRPVDELIRESDPLDDMMSQYEENLILAQGTDVTVHDLDDDQEHLTILDGLMAGDDTVQGRQFEDLHPDVQQVFFKHRVWHESALVRKQARRRGAEQRNPAFPIPTAELDPGRGTTGQRNVDLSPSGTTQSVPGETPGPPRAAAVPAADRMTPIPQAQNREGSNGL